MGQDYTDLAQSIVAAIQAGVPSVDVGGLVPLLADALRREEHREVAIALAGEPDLRAPVPLSAEQAATAPNRSGFSPPRRVLHRRAGSRL